MCKSISSFTVNAKKKNRNQSKQQHLGTDAAVWVLYLLCSQHHGHHTLGLSGLGALIDQDRTELHLGQTRVSSSDTSAADYVSILDNKEEIMIIICISG